MISKPPPWLAKVKFLLLPLVLGLATVMAVDYYLTQRSIDLDQNARAQLIARVVASRELKAGQHLQYDDLSIHELPRQWVGPDSFAPDQADSIIGKILLKDLRLGEPISRLTLSDPQLPALTEQLAPGRRAITMPVDYVNSLSGRLAPGDRIDLFVTFAHEGQRITTLLVSAVRVLATDEPLVLDSADGFGLKERSLTSVTLDVSPKEALKLVSAKLGGVLTAVLRVDDGSSTLSADTLSADHLAGFVGLSPSHGEGSKPTIFYGDSLGETLQGSEEGL
uniref:Flp pilus assembly protein CpaB n=1 Tax=Orrella sp. TaxID=1921583 RepID=UPI0040486479